MEQLLQLIDGLQSNDNSVRSTSEATITKIHSENPFEFAKIINEIIRNPQISIPQLSYAIILAWQLFPEEITDLKEDEPHPFDVYTNEIVSSFLETSFNLMIKGDLKIRHLAATMFGRIASLQVHMDINSKIVTKLAQTLDKSKDINVIKNLAIALIKICNEYEPENDELVELLTAVFNHLAEPESPEIANEMVKILSTIINAMSQILEEEGVASNVITILLNMSQIQESQGPAFACWNEIAKIKPEWIVDLSDQLLGLSLSVLAEDLSSDDALIGALKIIKKIAKIEMGYQSEIDLIRRNYNVIVMSIVKVCCGIKSPECDYSTSWNPSIAAKLTLKYVLRCLNDESLCQLIPLVQKLIESDLYQDRYGALVLLSGIIKYADDPSISQQFIQIVFALTNDMSSKIRREAINCLSYSIYRLREIKNRNNELLKIGMDLLNIISNIEDENVSYHVIKLMYELVQIPNFQETSNVLMTIFTRATQYRQFFIKNPFNYLTKIIDCGDSKAVKDFYPHVVSIFSEVITNPSTFVLISDLNEVVQAYIIRFGNEIVQYAEPVIQILFQILNMQNEFSCDTLIPLGLYSQIYRDVFAPYFSQFIDILAAVFNEGSSPSAIYSSATALYFVIHSGYDLSSQTPSILKLILDKMLPNLELSNEARRAILDLISIIAQVSPQIYSQFSVPIMTYVRSFSTTNALDIIISSDSTEAQLMLKALGYCTYYSMLAVGVQKSEEYVDLAISILTYVSDFEDVMERLMNCCLEILLYLSVHFKNDVLIAISENEDFGQFIVATESVDPKKAKLVLDNLGYTE